MNNTNRLQDPLLTKEISFMNNSSFHGKFESIQYNVNLAIIGAITSTSREKLQQIRLRVASKKMMV